MVAILGAGIQGCCIAVELAEAGISVDLFDKSLIPMCHASRWNEGKLHLGYVYANDPTLSTARAMVEGSLIFSEFFAQHLGLEIPENKRSSPFIYGIHKRSLLSLEKIQSHFQSIDKMIENRMISGNNPYLGESKLIKNEKLKPEDYFNPEEVLAAFRTPEKSVDTHFIADQLSNVILNHPRINFIGSNEIDSVKKKDDHSYTILLDDGTNQQGYRNVVNTTWEDRIRIDQTLGYKNKHSWIYRYKLAIHLSHAEELLEIPSCTFLLGPFGDVVNFGNGKFYFSWYPACCVLFSPEPKPVETIHFDPKTMETISQETYSQLRNLIPALKKLKFNTSEVSIKGGYICAPGCLDIDILSSELHRRNQKSIFHDDGYLSVFTGKYTSAPLNARIVRSLIKP